MSEKGVIRSIFQEAIRKKGTQTVVAEEARSDGAAISKFISGEGSLKMDVIERVFSMAGVHVCTEQDHIDDEAMIRGLARRALKL
jgi:hypothetical protein